MDVKTIAVIDAGTMGRALLRQYVREGRLGRKNGLGVYEYPQQKPTEKKA